LSGKKSKQAKKIKGSVVKKKEEVYFIQEGAIWATIQAAVQNTVVQIFAQVGKFDWREPYRIEEQFESYGSGFLIDEEGHIITNAHVVEGAKDILIQIPILGRQQLGAKIIGICPDRDVALLKISDEGLQIFRAVAGVVPYLLLGDSDMVRRTDSVLVLGYPLGQYHLKSTTGIISGQEFVFNSSLFEITAPVNPGSSGGPLLNFQGQVIGITVAMIPLAQNVGYVIPVNELKMVLNDLRNKKFVRTLHLGVQFVDSSDEKARFLHNPVPSGLYISHVFPGSMFDRAGVQPGDMLYWFNEFQIDAYGETKVPWSLDNVFLFDIISRIKIGDTIKIVVYRNGKRKDIEFVMGVAPLPAIRTRYPDYEDVSYDIFAGMVIMELAENHLPLLLGEVPELIRFQQPENQINSVVVITNIVPGCSAYQLSSLEPGTIIKIVNGMPIATLSDWKAAVKKSVDNDFVSLVTDRDALVVFSLKKVLDDEQRLSEAFAYPISENSKELQVLQKANYGKNKKTS
jgi:serine protease Do